MVHLYNMVIPWRSNTRTVVTADGSTATAPTFTPAAAAPRTSIHAQLKTLIPASRYSRSCKHSSFKLNFILQFSRNVLNLATKL